MSIGNINEVKRGDHCYRKKIPHQHHFIVTRTFLKNKMIEVIEFNGEKKNQAKVQRASYCLSHVKLYKVNHENSLPPDVVVALAEVFEEVQYSEYNLLENNCEHFAYFCKTGVFVSKQVAHGTGAAVGVATGATMVGAGAAVGTVVLPGIGTLVGAIAGGIAGIATGVGSGIGAHKIKTMYDMIQQHAIKVHEIPVGSNSWWIISYKLHGIDKNMEVFI